MSDVELKRKQTLTRHQAAERLRAFAAALDDGGHVELDISGTTLKVHVPEQVRAEFEIEVDGDEIELELELKWSTSPEPAAAEATGAEPAATKAATKPRTRRQS